MHALCTLCLAALTLALVPCATAAGCMIHVDPAKGDDQAPGGSAAPLATLHEAARRLAAMPDATDGDHDVTVCLAPGVHALRGVPLTLHRGHNRGSARVVWRAADGAQQATVSGGARLAKWVRCDDGTHCPGPEWHGVWAHAVADAPSTVRSLVPLRQLWVNGRWRALVSSGLTRSLCCFYDKQDSPPPLCQ